MSIFGNKNKKTNDKDNAKIKLVEVSLLHFDRDFKNVFQQENDMIRYLFIDLSENRFIKIRFVKLDFKDLYLRNHFTCCQVHGGSSNLVSPIDHLDLINKESFQCRRYRQILIKLLLRYSPVELRAFR